MPIDVLRTPEFDVQTIDVATVRLGATGYETQPATQSFKDIDRDGIALTGKTVGGDTVAGAASIESVKCKD